VASPPPPAALRFDLTNEAKRFAASSRFLRYIIGAGLVIIIITIGDQIVTGLVLPASVIVHEITVVLVVFLAALAVGCYWWVFHFSSPSASSLALDSDGVTLAYPNQKLIRILWNSRRPNLRLLLTYTGGPGFEGQPPSEFASLTCSMGKLNWVTPQAADAVIAQAESHGLSVIRREKSTKNGKSVDVRIGRSRPT
jgi:hypothetical protein